MKNKIDKIIVEAHSKIKKCLMESFPHLYFYISPEGNLTCWVRSANDRDGTGISLKHEINVGQILFHEWRYLQELNNKVELAHLEPKKYFYCSACGEVKPLSEYADFVMAADYCKKCAETPEISALISTSKKAGFYD